MTDRRFYPPKERKKILETLTGEGSPFSELRDALFFAAVLGWRIGRAEPFDAKGDGIRWEVMKNRLGTETMTSVLAYLHGEDPEVVAKDRSAERIEILEYYANGGLLELERRLSDAPGSVTDAILGIIQEHLESDGGDDAGPDDDIDLTKQALTL